MGYKYHKFKPRKNPEFGHWEHEKCTVVLTQEKLDALSSVRGGFRMSQLFVIKENRTTGWLTRIKGLKITQEQYDEMLSLRDPTTQEDVDKENRESEERVDKLEKEAKERRELRMTVKGHNGTYYDYLQSYEWSEIRRELFENRGEECELCGYGHSLQIHHLTYARLFNEDPSDLQILCRNCHEKVHGKGPTEKQRAKWEKNKKYFKEKKRK